MEEVTQLKYLGFVISDDASNVAEILNKKKKVNGPNLNIMNIIQVLGTYTIQNRIIHLNSLLGSKLLYTEETYYNLTERKLRCIESIEEE